MNCKSPGGTNDVAAYKRSSLPKLVESLPRTRYVVGDNAYTPTEHVLVPFSGSEKDDHGKDSYNYYLSQMRFRIEMAFDRLVSKWGILKSPLNVALKNATRITYCCTILHNFCINEGDIVPDLQAGDPSELPPEYYVSCDRSIRGQSQMRQYVLDKVNEHVLSRPFHNVLRNDI